MNACSLRHAVVLLLVALSGCASLEQPLCPEGQQAAIQDFLYFGTDMPDGTVSAEEWQRFVETTFTQGFPEGFTYWDAAGQWRTAAGEVLREDSYVLSLVHPDDAEAEASIRAYVDKYKTDFQQEAVLRVRSAACISF